MDDEITIELLKQIRDGVLQTNQQVAGVRQEVADQVGGLKREVTEVGVRLERVEQGLSDLGGFMKQIALDMAKYERFHIHHVEVIEKDLDDVKARLRRLEDRSPSG
ncbi:MAG TPA: hypothetical protein VML75_02140 [Kofleriaceae bacterium]|nr:hypothetical protein [Kofleriaceae bacterium]